MLLSWIQTSATSVIQLEDRLLDPQSEMVLRDETVPRSYWSQDDLWNSSVQDHWIHVPLVEPIDQEKWLNLDATAQ